MNLLLIEDNAATAERRPKRGERNGESNPVVVRLHRINRRGVDTIGETQYKSGSLRKDRGGRASIGLELLHTARASRNRSLVVAGTSYGSNLTFVRGALDDGFQILAELRPSAMVRPYRRARSSCQPIHVKELLGPARWEVHDVQLPSYESPVPCRAAKLGPIELDRGPRVGLLAADVGALNGVHRGTIIALYSSDIVTVRELIHAAWWTRWIRPYMRRKEREPRRAATIAGAKHGGENGSQARIELRSNITLAERQDSQRDYSAPRAPHGTATGHGYLASKAEPINVIELFAGAGGMGLGFLLSRRRNCRFRLVFSGEIEPIYVQTLKQNHASFAKGKPARLGDFVPPAVEPINLRLRGSVKLVEKAVQRSGGVDVLIGGPPCQGFSNANRNSWYPDNPNNGLVNVFMRYVERLDPWVFLMENVQGIIWTRKNGRRRALPSVADHISRRMRKAGYIVFPKVLDAVWYGVPQYRTRFFVMGIHKDLGYSADDFGDWGPFPLPTHGPANGSDYVTLRDSIADLPQIGNGEDIEVIPYSEKTTRDADSSSYLKQMRRRASRGLMLDHVTSRHSDYVIERYRQIPPGGNWQDIAHMMTNYAEVSRTHSNIYRRLEWDKPAITIGHYRKSMLVHPDQNRGLSLREACRLQSFPDWFRFAGTHDGRPGGLVHKQQQLANAVCPLVSKAIGTFILGL